jgi:methionine-rich copper-binding protein CopC
MKLINLNYLYMCLYNMRQNYYPSSSFLLTRNTLVGIFIIFLIAILFLENNAYGHANPVSYSPAANSIIQQVNEQSLPSKVTILFSERPEPKVSYIHVTNSKNVRVDNNDYTISEPNNREATITLDTSNLSAGVYTVSWLALSRDDGHISKGSYVFSISPAQQSSSSNSVSENKTFSEQATIDNVNLKNEITPFSVGINTFNVTLTDQQGNPAKNITNVIMQFTNTESNIGPIVANLAKNREGQYSVTGGYLSQPGEWNIKVTAQRSGAYDLNYSFKETIREG